MLYVWLKITITKGEGFPVLGDPATAIAREISAWGNGGPSPTRPLEAYAGLGLGQDLDLFQLGGPINKAVRGVKSATIEAGTTPGPFDPEPGYAASDIVVGPNAVLVLSRSRRL